MYTYGHSLGNTALSNPSFVMYLIDIDIQNKEVVVLFQGWHD